MTQIQGVSGLARERGNDESDLQVAEAVDQGLILLWRTDRNTQELCNALLFEVPHDHSLLT